MAALGLLALGGCGLLDRIFDPVGEEGRLIAVEPKFSTIQVGTSIELQASVFGDPDQEPSFEFSENSAGLIVRLVPLDGGRALVTGVSPGQATVFASADEDEGLALVTVSPTGP